MNVLDITMNQLQFIRQTVTDQIHTSEGRNNPCEFTTRIEEIIENAQRSSEGREAMLEGLRMAIRNELGSGRRMSRITTEMERNFGMKIGIFFMIVGLFLAYMGRRIFKLFLMITGFIVFSSTSVILIISAKPRLIIPISATALECIALFAGIIGAIIFMNAWKFAVYCMSFHGGMLMGFWVLGMVREIREAVNETFFIVACSVLAGLCAHYMDELLVIVSSSLAGAFTTCFGVYIMKQRGLFHNLIQIPHSFSFLDENEHVRVRNYMIGILFITISGIYVQYRCQPRSYDKE